MNQSQAPKGWFLAGDQPQSYTIGTEKKSCTIRPTCAYLKSTKPITEEEGFGSLMQHFKAERYRGKRLQLSAYVQTKDVKGWVGLWMRVDAANQRTVSFDNMQNRSITGSTDWTRDNVVLDVPEESELIAFGILLAGSGTARIADVTLEPVGLDVPTTDTQPKMSLPDEPVNLDFSDGAST